MGEGFKRRRAFILDLVSILLLVFLLLPKNRITPLLFVTLSSHVIKSFRHTIEFEEKIRENFL